MHDGSVATRRFASRRRRWAAAGAAVVLMVLAACSTEAPPATSGDLSEEGPLQITWYGSDARNAAVQEVVDMFAKQNPGVTIESQPTTFDKYWDRVSVQAAADNLACVPSMQSRYEARYENRGSLLPLDDLIASGAIDVSGIPAELLDSQRAADGKLYVIPLGIWYEGAVLNAPAIESVGASVPDPNGSWDDYVNWAIQTQPSVAPGTFAIADRGGQLTQFQAFALGRGENLFVDGKAGFSEQTLIDWFKLWKSAVDVGAAPSPQATAEEVGMPVVQTQMAQGLNLVTSTGDNNISDFQITLDQNGKGQVSIAPSPTGGKPQVVGTNGWAISANCTNVKNAAAFIDFFINSYEGALILQTQTGLPPVASVLEQLVANPDTSPAIKERATLFGELVDRGALIDVWPDGTQQLVAQFVTAHQEVSFGQTAPEQAAVNFVALVNTALAGS